MRRTFRFRGILALVLIAGLVFWSVALFSHRSSTRSGLGDSLHSAITNPVDFAKSRVTGGVGLILRVDTATGLPGVQGVGIGSPAESLGLRAGDVILRIDGASTAGKPLAQIVQEIHGFTGARVTLTVQRTGSTNFQATISRSSWSKLRGLNFKQGP